MTDLPAVPVGPLHDDPRLFPTLPPAPCDPETWASMLRSVVGTPWQTCWEYKLTHHLTPAEGVAFWTGANLAAAAARTTLVYEVEGANLPRSWSPLAGTFYDTLDAAKAAVDAQLAATDQSEPAGEWIQPMTDRPGYWARIFKTRDTVFYHSWAKVHTREVLGGQS